MAAVGVVQVRCPECDVAVPITTEMTSRGREGNVLIMSIEPDLTDVIVHSWSHDLASGDQRTLIQSETDIGGIPPTP